MASDTTFEYALHNIYEKDSIISSIYSNINQIDDTRIATYIDRIRDEYNAYQNTMNRFNIEIAQLISEYYNINDDYKDAFNTKIIYTYSSNPAHYSPLVSQEATDSNIKFDVKELIDIFTEHCYEFKKFNLYNSVPSFKHSKMLEKEIFNKLNDYILSEGICESINSIIHEYNLFMKWFGSTIDQDTVKTINRLLIKYESINLEVKTNELVFDVCECGTKMEIHPVSSEMVCEKCGYSYMLEGTVLEDTMFYSQTETRYKHANYQPAKHCRCWLERIQAKENNTISKEHLDKIESCIKRDNINNKKAIPVSQFRKYLKDCNLSELNEHIALIRKLVTGVSPPCLTYAETQIIINAFSKSVKAYNLIKPNTKLNILYYPFVIRKLIEMHVSDYNKKKELLAFIHLQGSNTLSQNDKLWAQICKVIPEFIFKPTDRYEFVD